MGGELNLRALHFFLVVVEEGSFGKAALRLHISQPALSVQIGRLEQNLGAQLLTRSHRGVEPTAAGELLARDGRRLLGSAAALGDRVRALAEPPGPTLRLGFLANAAAELTPLLVRAFDLRRPDANLELHEFHFAEPLLGLDSGRSDAALLRPPVDGSDQLEMVELFAEPRVVVLPVEHRLAGRQSVEVAELLDEPWVIGSHGAFRDFWELANHRSAPPPLVIERGTVPEWYSEVAAGHAICASPLSASRYDRRPEIAFVPIADAEPSVCALAWPRGEESPELEALVEAALEVSRALPAELRA